MTKSGKLILSIVLNIVVTLALLVVGDAAAGTLEVWARDNNGDVLIDEWIWLTLVSLDLPEGQTLLDVRKMRLRRMNLSLDRQGRAVFEVLPAGTYRVDLPRPTDPRLVLPRANPASPAPVVTLAGDEQLRVDLELWRGIPVRVDLDVPGGDPSGFVVHFEQRDGVGELQQLLSRRRLHAEQTLPIGSWDVSVKPLPGYLLQAVERDRIPVNGSVVKLDLVQQPADTQILFSYTAPARLEGKVDTVDGSPPAVAVVATLLEPGSWFEAAQRRGGSIYDEVSAGPDPKTGDYEMVLPDGRWQIRPQGTRLLASEPEKVEMVLEPGGSHQADFLVRLEESEGKWFQVRVLDRSHRPVVKAAVEVRPLGSREAPILGRELTGRSGAAAIKDIEDGDLLVVAGHADTLEGRLELPKYRAADRRSPEMILSRGARIRVKAQHAHGKALAGAQVKLERLDPLPTLLLEDDEFLQAKAERTLATDDSGRAQATGFYGGRYRLIALMPSESEPHLLVLSQSGQTPRSSLEIDLGEDETLEVIVQMRPASMLRWHLACADGFTLPAGADIRLVAPEKADLQQLESSTGAAQSFENVSFVGAGGDQLNFGPVVEGAYRLALRPAEFDRWVWYFATFDSEESADILVTYDDSSEGKRTPIVDLGTMAFECGPQVDLLPTVASGAPFPELEDVEIEARALDSQEDLEIGPELTVRVDRGWLLIRDLPLGSSRLEVTLRHPHLMPGAELSWVLNLDLDKGEFQEAQLEMAALGGAIQIRHQPENARTARLLCGQQEAIFIGPEDGFFLFPSIAPATCDIDLCADDECDESLRRWTGLEVLAGQTRVQPATD